MLSLRLAQISPMVLAPRASLEGSPTSSKIFIRDEEAALRPQGGCNYDHLWYKHKSGHNVDIWKKQRHICEFIIVSGKLFILE